MKSFIFLLILAAVTFAPLQFASAADAIPPDKFSCPDLPASECARLIMIMRLHSLPPPERERPEPIAPPPAPVIGASKALRWQLLRSR